MQTDRDTPTSAAGHAECPATSVDEVVGRPCPTLRLKRAGRFLRVRVQRRWGATFTLEGQEAIGQEAQAGVAVEAGPGAPLEVVQPKFLLELLIALLHLPAGFPQTDPVRQRRGGWQIGQRVADRAIAPPFDQQPARLGLRIGHVIGRSTVLPLMRWPHPPPRELGMQGSLGALAPAEGCAFEGLRKMLDGDWGAASQP